jgi:peptide/nickel transport system substrate-binding protein
LKLFRIAAIVAAAGLVATGTGAAGASTQAAAKPRQGGTLTFLKQTEAPAYGWDPVKFQGTQSAFETPQAFAIFDALFYEDPATLRLVPRLGLSFTSTDAGTTWTLKLRPDVKFSDGTDFNADAVQFNWQRAQNPANMPSTLGGPVAAQIQTMTVVDPLTLRVMLKSPDPNWNRRVAEKQAWIGSPTALRASATAFATKPVGAGPFILKDWVRDSQYTFARNPNYWEKGQPYLDQLVVKLVPDDTTALNTVRSGAANVQMTYDPTIAAQGKQSGFKVAAMASNGGGWSILFNTAKAPFNDVRVRQAINMAIDRQAFNTNRRNGDTSMLMTTTDAPGTPFYDPTVRMPKYDLAGAQKLIDAVVAETGKPVQFTLTYFNTAQYIVQDAQYLSAQLSKLKNLEITQEPLGASAVVAKYSPGAFQAVLNVNQARWNEPAIDVVNLFQSTSSGNISRYSNPTVDAALNQLVTAADQKTREQLVHTAMAQIVKDAPMAWYTRTPSFAVLDKSVRGYDIYFDQIPLSDGLWAATNK